MRPSHVSNTPFVRVSDLMCTIFFLVTLFHCRAACVLAAGHIGFLGRAGVFLFVGVLFFRLIANPDINNSQETTIGNGLAQLQKTRGGRACLFILGLFLIVYGTFAVCKLVLSLSQYVCVSKISAFWESTPCSVSAFKMCAVDFN